MTDDPLFSVQDAHDIRERLKPVRRLLSDLDRAVDIIVAAPAVSPHIRDKQAELAALEAEAVRAREQYVAECAERDADRQAKKAAHADAEAVELARIGAAKAGAERIEEET